ETVFQSLGGYHELSLVRVNMDTLAPTLWIDANVIDCWVALLNFEELALGYPSLTRHFFLTGCIVFFPIYASDHFYVVVFNIKKLKTMVILDNIKNRNNCDPPKQVKETDAANVVVSVNEAVDQVKEKGCRKK
ncbi:ulp1 protease family, C-terminal catalytic domain-containing protein, partial [Tanacetum coccineum]